MKPLYGAVAAALLAATIIGVVSLRAKQCEDTVIGARGPSAWRLVSSSSPGRRATAKT